MRPRWGSSLLLAQGEPTVGPEQFGSGRAADDWSWIDRLKNADEATKERLKRCARSATENFAAIRRLIFDYDLVREFGHTDESSKTTNVISAQYHGTVYWRDGSVRYDFDGLYPMHKIVKNGLVFIMKRSKVYSVVRSREMLAYTEENPVYGLWLTVMKPPQSVGDWEKRSFAPLRHLDPWLYYAGPFCSDTKMMREVWEDCRAIESEEKGSKVLLRFIHNNDQQRARGSHLRRGRGLVASAAPGGRRAGRRVGRDRRSEHRMEEEFRRLVPEPLRQDGLLEQPQTRQGDRSDRPEPAGQRRRQCAGVPLHLERHEGSRWDSGSRHAQ